MKSSITSKIWEWLCDATRLYFAPALGAIKGAVEHTTMRLLGKKLSARLSNKA